MIEAIWFYDKLKIKSYDLSLDSVFLLEDNSIAIGGFLESSFVNKESGMRILGKIILASYTDEDVDFKN